MNKKHIPVITLIAACSDMGKTTMVQKLIREGKRRGWKIAAIKHDAHDFQMDQEGKDTWKFAQAGADIVAISSADKLAYFEYNLEKASLSKIFKFIHGVDLIIAEGFKSYDLPKIEVFREVKQTEPLNQEGTIAFICDKPLKTARPCFGFDEVGEICDFLENLFNLPS